MLATSQRSTVGDFLDYWLAQVVRPNVRQWTYAGYEVHVRLHLKPALGHLRLDKLTPIHVQQFLNQKIADGMKPRSVRYIRGTLRTALSKAVKWDLISRNVAALVRGPRVERYDIRPLTPDEARAFLDAMKGDRLEALYAIALTMGLRQGEVLGLRWQDIDLETAELRVTKQLQRVDGKLQLVAPKTARSRRMLAVPASTAWRLREPRNRQLKEQADQIQKVLGSEQVNALAAKIGVDPAQASHFLAEYLPKVVDKLTPEGKVDPTADHQQGLANLLPALLQSFGSKASGGSDSGQA
jgi:integrase